MTLRIFIRDFVESNTMIRLWYPYGQNYEPLTDRRNPQMEFQWNLSTLARREVIGVTDILCDSYVEAVNIIIKRK